MNEINDKDICITGIGLVSAFGETLRDFCNGINGNKSEATYITNDHILKNKKIPAFKALFEVGSELPEDRILSMGKKVILDALKDRKSNLLPNVERVCLIVGSGMGLVDQYFYDESKSYEPNYFSSLGEKLSEITGLNCEAVYIGNACAAGSQAISYGMDLLKLELYDLVIAGGIDILSQAAYAGFMRLNAIDVDGCKPFDKRRKGIAIGEGSVFYTLERREGLGSDRNIYCTLPGAGVTCDAYHIVQMNPNGKEAIRAMDQAVAFSGFDKKDINLIVAHGTGTTQNDRIESQIINQFFGDYADDLYVTAPKGAIGHTGGTSGSFGVLTAICAIKTGFIPAVCNLEEPDSECNISIVIQNRVKNDVRLVMVNAFAFGGTNIVLLCKKESDVVE